MSKKKDKTEYAMFPEGKKDLARRHALTMLRKCDEQLERTRAKVTQLEEAKEDIENLLTVLKGGVSV